MKTAKKNGQSKPRKSMGSSKAPENLILLAGSMDILPSKSMSLRLQIKEAIRPTGKCLCAVDSGSCRNSQLVKTERMSYCGALSTNGTSGSHLLPKAQELLMKGEGNIARTRGERGWEQNRVFGHGRAAHSDWGCQSKTGS